MRTERHIHSLHWPLKKKFKNIFGSTHFFGSTSDKSGLIKFKLFQSIYFILANRKWIPGWHDFQIIRLSSVPGISLESLDKENTN